MASSNAVRLEWGDQLTVKDFSEGPQDRFFFAGVVNNKGRGTKGRKILILDVFDSMLHPVRLSTIALKKGPSKYVLLLT